MNPADAILKWLTWPFRDVFAIDGVVLAGGAVFDVHWWDRQRRDPSRDAAPPRPHVRDFDLLVPHASVDRVKEALLREGFFDASRGTPGASRARSGIIFRCGDCCVDVVTYDGIQGPTGAASRFDLDCLQGTFDGARTYMPATVHKDLEAGQTVATRSLPEERARKYLDKGIRIVEPWPRIPTNLHFPDAYRWGHAGGPDWRTWPRELAVESRSFDSAAAHPANGVF